MKIKVNQDWKVRAYRDSDINCLSELYKNVNGIFDYQYWKWLFQENTAGQGDICFADHDGDIVGQYANIPIKMRIQGKDIHAMQSLHLMIHSKYRRQGMFTALAQFAFKEIKDKGINLIYGFPNDNSFHGFLKYHNFFVLEKLSAMTKPLNIEEFPKIKNIGISRAFGAFIQFVFDKLYYPSILKSKDDDMDIKIEIAHQFPKEIDNLLSLQISNFPNSIIRNYDYLSWRYERNPNHSYDIYLGYRDNNLAGYCVCGDIERESIRIGLIMDIFADPCDNMLLALLIKNALKGMVTKKMTMASCVLTSTSPFLKILKKYGFIFPLRRFPYILKLNSINNELNLKSIRCIDNWHITFGDADFI